MDMGNAAAIAEIEAFQALIARSDPRAVKAVAIAQNAGQWAKVRTANGQKMYGVQSAVDSLHLYLVTATTCTCQDFERRGPAFCKHILAVRLHCALKLAGVQPVGTAHPVRARYSAADYDRVYADLESGDI